MNRLPFVGREAELQKLTAALEAGAEGHGRIVLVEGSAGAGKSLLLNELLQRARSAPRLKDAVFAFGHCYEETGPQNAYQPFIEILAELVGSSVQKKRFLEILWSAIKETASDWLAVIPILGPLLSAGAKTASVASGLVVDSQAVKSISENVLRQYAERITALAQHGHLVTLVVEDAHWIDFASCELIRLLSTRLAECRLVVILTCRPTELSSDDPLNSLRSELSMRDCLDVVELDGLTEAEIDRYLVERFGTSFFPAFSRWMQDLCQGHALFIAQYLNLLEQEQVIHRVGDGFHLDGEAELRDEAWTITGRMAELPASSDIDALLDRRIQRLLDEEREMLQIGAVQGQRFDSLILAQVSEKKELTILAQLRRVSDRHRLISRYTGQDWMRNRSETYAFEHALLHQAFYRKLGPRERVLYHMEIGQALRKIVAEYRPAPRKLLIDVAYHAKNGGEPATAATYYLVAAQASYFDGATVEAAHLCDQALACLRGLAPGAADRDVLLADCALLYLLCEMAGAGNRARNLSLVAVAEEGEAAAARAGRQTVLAEILASKGQVYVRLGQVPKAIEAMRQAVELARQTGDPVTEFFTLTQLGKQLAKASLVESMEVRYRALEVYETQVAAATLSPERRDIILRQLAALVVYIGLGEFDQGNYEKALDSIERGMRDLERFHLYDELLAGLNYQAQVHASLGNYPAAEQHLQQSIELSRTHNPEVDHPSIGYNLGLLGKIHLETGRVEAAEEAMREAVRISEAAEQADLLGLVRNFHAELLMHPGRPPADLEAAERVLLRNLTESRAAGIHRSAVQAASLLGLLMLKRSAFDDALAYSQQAVDDLERLGDMPAVRTEEILFNHHLVLRALGKPADAASYLERAWQRVRRKAGDLKKPELKRSFLENVPLNRSIREAYAAGGR